MVKEKFKIEAPRRTPLGNDIEEAILELAAFLRGEIKVEEYQIAAEPTGSVKHRPRN